MSITIQNKYGGGTILVNENTNSNNMVVDILRKGSATDVPIGAITPYNGLVRDIPAGWILCDGTNGSADLNERFLVGASIPSEIKQLGGHSDVKLVKHTHAITVPAYKHKHTWSAFTRTTGYAGNHKHTIELWCKHTTLLGAGGHGGGVCVQVHASLKRTETTNYAGGYTHTYNPGSKTTNSAGGHGHTVTLDSKSIGVDGNESNLPPYYTLAYIQKI